MAPESSFDLIVVGLGAMGAATIYQARRLGLNVLGIDRHRPPHGHGSTHAETRITRLAVGEGEQYLPFVRRSHEIWRQLEQEGDESLLHQCGGLIVTARTPRPGARWRDFVLETSKVADAAGVDFEIVDRHSQRVPSQLRGLTDHRIGYEPTAGLVMAERAVAVQLAAAERGGAAILIGETVRELSPDATGVTVATGHGVHRADQAVLSTGPWMTELADPVDAGRLSVTRQVVFWFEVEDVDAFRTASFPFIMWIGDSDEDYAGIFPIPPGATPALKVLGEQFHTTTDPERVDRSVGAEEIDSFFQRHVGPRLVGVKPRCVRADVCLYTNTDDDHFLIDRSPRSDRITIMSPCSGHGFKHSAALGEAVAQLVARGRSDLDLSPFRRDRGSTAGC